MHCHTNEGSIDARVGIADYVNELINKGVDGMLITDHNSYKGYEHWQRIKTRRSRTFYSVKRNRV